MVSMGASKLPLWEGTLGDSETGYDRAANGNEIPPGGTEIIPLGALLPGDVVVVHGDVVDESGIPAFDEAIVEAWRLAAPFENPPPGMVAEDGFIHIDDFGFHIEIGRAKAELTGIDPRQDVMFPGLQTIPGR